MAWSKPIRLGKTLLKGLMAILTVAAIGGAACGGGAANDDEEIHALAQRFTIVFGEKNWTGMYDEMSLRYQKECPFIAFRRLLDEAYSESPGINLSGLTSLKIDREQAEATALFEHGQEATEIKLFFLKEEGKWRFDPLGDPERGSEEICRLW